MDLRERKKQATREALQEAAIRLFGEKGFTATSVDEIAAAAEVSRSTFFRYFGSKEAVLFSETDETGERFLELLARRPASEGPVKAFEEALVALSGEHDHGRRHGVLADRGEVVASEPALRARESEIRERYVQKVAEALAARERSPGAGARHRVAAALCVALTRELGEEWLAEPQDLETLVRGRFELVRELLD